MRAEARLKAKDRTRSPVFESLNRLTTERSVAAVATATTAVAAAAITATATAITAEATRAASTAGITTIATESAGAWGAFFAWTGDVHRQSATFHLEVVEFFHGLLGFVAGGHGDESKSAGAAGKLVEDDLNDADGADLTKQGLKILGGASEGKVPNVELTVVHVMNKS